MVSGTTGRICWAMWIFDVSRRYVDRAIERPQYESVWSSRIEERCNCAHTVPCFWEFTRQETSVSILKVLDSYFSTWSIVMKPQPQ
jgi:hypothetical protein